jgi:RNA polymerase sigma-70 factor (ECF subfamily)
MINHLFRIESGKMVSVLVKIFGTENYQLAEDVVQDSLLAALNSWKFNGIPEQPRSWLYRVAKNKAIDILRKKKSDIEFNPSDSERILLSSE